MAFSSEPMKPEETPPVDGWRFKTPKNGMQFAANKSAISRRMIDDRHVIRFCTSVTDVLAKTGGTP